MMRDCTLQLAFAVSILSGCRTEVPDLEAERRAILAADEAWLAAVARKDVDETVSYWTDDATIFPPDMPAVKGKAAIREYVAGAFQIPGSSLTWESEEITVASDGKTAYQFATNRFTAPDSTGTPRVIEGKAVVIWRKEPDGAWRSVVDIWNGTGSTQLAPPARE